MAAGGPGDIYAGKTVLITGGTGSLGKPRRRFLETDVGASSSTAATSSSSTRWSSSSGARDRLRFFIGDVRDRDRLYRAFVGVDFVIHAAALKHVHLMEYNPHRGREDQHHRRQEHRSTRRSTAACKKVIALSTDKAVNPVNLYGATKLVSDKLFRAAHAYSGERHPSSSWCATATWSAAAARSSPSSAT